MMKNTLKMLSIIALALFAGCATPKKVPEDTFIIERTFNTGASTLFEMWTNPDSFTQWLGPTGAEMKFINTGVREEGSSLWSMKTIDGNTKFGKINYKVISPNDLLIYTQYFTDKDGKMTKPFFSATYPDILRTTIMLTPISSDKTKLSVKWEIEGQATEQERQTFIGMKNNMKIGWGQSFDKLEVLLNSKK